MQSMKDIFLAALELPRSDRPRFLDEHCGDDDAKRQRIERLIEAHEQSRGFMEAPTVDVARVEHDVARSDTAPLRVGDVLGHYRLESVLGEGGFGTVFLAQQTQPVERTVAIKVLKPGVYDPTVITRMDAERQVLALMAHPGIARIFDAGQTSNGQPYFAMEYVRGEPITTYCEQRALGLRARLELFENVALAVQHAHHKGVIHRDLKPQNVLVTEIDGAPTPKVIDFGIAKIVGPRAAHQTALTQAGDMLGTPAYMSPEQIEGQAGTDTRSDVYSLGVLIYELLTGRLPFEMEGPADNLAALMRRICETEPARPSDRDTPHDAILTATTSTHLRGDLDWIVMRALEKSRDRRYGSAGDLAADVRRHLDDRPVEAGPPSVVYLFKKFALRHRGEVAAGTAALGLLVALLITFVVYAALIDRERHRVTLELEKSEAFSEFASDLLRGVDPAVARGMDTTLLRSILDDAAAGFETDAPGSLEVEALTRELVGTGYSKIGQFERAHEQFTRATLLADDADMDTETSLRLREATATTLVDLSQFDEAEAALREILDIRRSVQGVRHPDTLGTLFNIGVIRRIRGDNGEAKAIFEEVAALRSEVLGPRDPKTLSTRNSLATTIGTMGETTEAIAIFEDVIEIQREVLGPEHPHTLSTRNNLADVYMSENRDAEAIPIMEEVLNIRRRVLNADHPSLLISMNNLANAYRRVGQIDKAEPMMVETYDFSRRVFGDDDRRTLITLNNLAGHYVKSDRPMMGYDLLIDAIPVSERVMGAEHPLTLAMLSYVAAARLATGPVGDAVDHAEQLVACGDATWPDDHAERANYRRLLGEALIAADRASDAVPILLVAIDVDRARDDADSAGRTADLLVRAYEALEQPDQAAQWRSWNLGDDL